MPPSTPASQKGCSTRRRRTAAASSSASSTSCRTSANLCRAVRAALRRADGRPRAGHARALRPARLAVEDQPERDVRAVQPQRELRPVASRDAASPIREPAAQDGGRAEARATSIALPTPSGHDVVMGCGPRRVAGNRQGGRHDDECCCAQRNSRISTPERAATDGGREDGGLSGDFGATTVGSLLATTFFFVGRHTLRVRFVALSSPCGRSAWPDDRAPALSWRHGHKSGTRGHPAAPGCDPRADVPARGLSLTQPG